MSIAAYVCFLDDFSGPWSESTHPPTSYTKANRRCCLDFAVRLSLSPVRVLVLQIITLSASRTVFIQRSLVACSLASQQHVFDGPPTKLIKPRNICSEKWEPERHGPRWRVRQHKTVTGLQTKGSEPIDVTFAACSSARYIFPLGQLAGGLS